MSSLNDEVDVLRRIPLFAEIDPAKLKLLAFTSKRIAFTVGQNVLKQGSVGDAAYVIISGQADVLLDTSSGEIVVTTLSGNDLVGEISILCDIPRTATIRARSDLDTLKIDKEIFLNMMHEFPEMSVEVMRVLADRLGKTTAELAEIHKNNANTKQEKSDG